MATESQSLAPLALREHLIYPFKQTDKKKKLLENCCSRQGGRGRRKEAGAKRKEAGGKRKETKGMKQREGAGERRQVEEGRGRRQWEGKEKRASRCNSTNMQNQPIQQKCLIF